MAKKWFVGIGATAVLATVLAVAPATMAQGPGAGGSEALPGVTQQEPGAERAGCRGKGLPLALAAETLGMTIEDLQAELAAEQSLAQVAEAQGIGLEELVDALLAPKAERLAEAVAAGDLTQEEADARLEDARTRLTDKVQQVGLPTGPRGGDRAPRFSPDTEG